MKGPEESNELNRTETVLREIIIYILLKKTSFFLLRKLFNLPSYTQMKILFIM